jgi:hypothetical protein
MNTQFKNILLYYDDKNVNLTEIAGYPFISYKVSKSDKNQIHDISSNILNLKYKTIIISEGNTAYYAYYVTNMTKSKSLLINPRFHFNGLFQTPTNYIYEMDHKKNKIIVLSKISYNQRHLKEITEFLTDHEQEFIIYDRINSENIAINLKKLMDDKLSDSI